MQSRKFCTGGGGGGGGGGEVCIMSTYTTDV